MTVRAGVVNEIVLTLGDLDRPLQARRADVHRLGATREEWAAAGELMARSAVDDLRELGTLAPVEEPTILDLTWPQLQALWFRHLKTAKGLAWVLNFTNGSWGGAGMTLGNLLKVMPADRAREIAEQLAAHDIHDLDPLLQPDEPEG
jgi:hypothetical protein